MPSTNTITAFHTFSPQTLIRSSQHNTNFSNFRGHLLPINTDTATASDATHNLGSDTHRWALNYSNINVMYSQSTPAANPTTGSFKVYMKSDGLMYRLNSTGTEASVAASSGGGGGGSLTWIEGALAPLRTQIYNTEAYEFPDSDTLYIYTSFKVPSTYVAGTAVSLKGTFFTPATSGTYLLTSLATLIRTGTDAMSSTTNQQTSTNLAVTAAATANKPNAVTWNLSSAGGAINSVAISAGDIILVRITRDTATDTGTAIAYLQTDTIEVVYG